MSYWESYWVKGDIIEDYYESEEGDQGIHLLIGDPDYLGKGLALPFLRAMVKFQLLTSTTNKVMAEPDIRNAKMIHLFEKCGFTPIKEIELPDKTALLMSCTRGISRGSGTMEKQQSIYDLVGVGIGPFNLGLAALLEKTPELNAVFLRKRGNLIGMKGCCWKGQRCKCRSLPIWLAWQM